MSDTSAVERKLAEELGFRFENRDGHFLLADGIGIREASKFESALWRALVARETERRWIPVSERMPEPSMDYNQQFLVLCDDKQQVADYCKTLGGKWAFWREKKDGRPNKRLFPTHWRPLPQPPERSK